MGNAHYDILYTILSGKWMVVFGNEKGDSFIMNVEFPAMTTYSYVFNDEESSNNLTITFKVLQNIPTIAYNGVLSDSQPLLNSKCEYDLSKIKSLKMIDIYRSKVSFDDDGIILYDKGNNLKTIEFNPTSLSFTDAYDGNTFNQTLSFSIPFESYLYYFHYNLLEFKDNRYYCIIETTLNNYIIGGFKFGLFPSYSVSENNITLTLTNINNSYTSIGTDNLSITDEEYIVYQAMSGECINNHYTTTLIKEANKDNYYCLEGYEDDYSSYNIIGTYDKYSTEFGIKIIDYNVDCSSECDISGLPENVIFTDAGQTSSFTVNSDCELTFNYDSTNINVTYSNNTLVISSKTANDGDYIIEIIAENGRKYNILAIIDTLVDNIQTFVVSWEAQLVKAIPFYGTENITQVDSDLLWRYNDIGDGILFDVPENESQENITYTNTLTYTNGRKEIIYILQGEYSTTIYNNGKEKCIGNDLYEVWDVYVEVEGELRQLNSMTGNQIETDSEKCMFFDEKIAVCEQCIDGVSYTLHRYKYQGVEVAVKYNSNSTSCSNSASSKYITNTAKTICVDDVAYYVEELWGLSCEDNTSYIKVYPVIEETTSEVAEDSIICDVIDARDAEPQYRWVDTEDTICTTGGTSLDTFSFRFTGTFSNFVLNDIDFKATDENSVNNGDGTYTYTTTLSELGINVLTDCSYVFDHDTVELITFPDTSNVTTMNSMFDECDLITELDLSSFNTSNVTDMQSLFRICELLQTLNVSSWDVEQVTSYANMLAGCDALTSLIIKEGTYDWWCARLGEAGISCDIITVGDSPTPLEGELSFEFSGDTTTYKLNGTTYTATTSPYSTTLSELGISQLTSCYQAFSGNTSITNLISFPDTTNVTNMGEMFHRCSSVNSINLSNFNTSNVTRMSYMFGLCENLTSLDLTSFNTSNVTNMGGMFQSCSKLTSLDLTSFNTSNVTGMNQMFNSCSSLTELDLSNFNTSNVKYIYHIFNGCYNLQSINVSSWDVNHITSDYSYDMFYNCPSLTSLYIKEGTYDWWCARLGESGISCDIIVGDSPTPDTCTSSTTYSNFKCVSITLDDDTVVTPTNDYYYLNKTVAWNEVYDGIVSVSYTKDKTVVNTDCTSATTTETFTTTNFTYVYSPSGNNETTEDREVFANMFENGMTYIGRIYYTQEGKPSDTGTTDELSFEFTGDTMIYRLNNTTYSATTSPYSTTLEDLGITELTSCYRAFSGTSITNLISFPDTSNVTTMSNLFNKCSNLTSLDLSNFNTSSVTTMRSMLSNCLNLTSLDVSNFNTSVVTDMYQLFYNCSSLTSLDLSSFNTSAVTNMYQLFYNCSALTSLDLSSFNTSSVTTMGPMFQNCVSLTSLDLSSFNTSACTNIGGMFYNCSALTSLDLSSFNTSACTNINSMFYNCSALTSLDLSSFNTSNITNISQLFYNCSSLQSLNMSSWDVSNITSYSYMFRNCTSLRTLTVKSGTEEWWLARLTDAGIASNVTITSV